MLTEEHVLLIIPGCTHVLLWLMSKLTLLHELFVSRNHFQFSHLHVQ
jgi:hypothetical protein